MPLQLKSSSVGYCHETEGCKLAATGLRSLNGIATSGNGTYYAASVQGYIQSFEAQKDNTFTLGDTIKLGERGPLIVRPSTKTDETSPDRPIDNLAVAADGALYAGSK
jgi:arylesterase/paraoxonase